MLVLQLFKITDFSVKCILFLFLSISDPSESITKRLNFNPMLHLSVFQLLGQLVVLEPD